MDFLTALVLMFATLCAVLALGLLLEAWGRQQERRVRLAELRAAPSPAQPSEVVYSSAPDPDAEGWA